MIPMNPVKRYVLVYCDTCRRLREILKEAPWSSFDLLSSVIVLGLGVYLLFQPNLFEQFGGLYRVFAEWADEMGWGALFVSCGLFGLGMVCWPARPVFGLRLLARMAVAFCLLTLTINYLGNNPPAAAAITNAVLSLAATWGILRTRRHGR